MWPSATSPCRCSRWQGNRRRVSPRSSLSVLLLGQGHSRMLACSLSFSRLFRPLDMHNWRVYMGNMHTRTVDLEGPGGVSLSPLAFVCFTILHSWRARGIEYTISLLNLVAAGLPGDCAPSQPQSHSGSPSSSISISEKKRKPVLLCIDLFYDLPCLFNQSPGAGRYASYTHILVHSGLRGFHLFVAAARLSTSFHIPLQPLSASIPFA